VEAAVSDDLVSKKALLELLNDPYSLPARAIRAGFIAALSSQSAVCCEECTHSWREDGYDRAPFVYHPAFTCGDCYCGSNFERRQP